MSSVHQQKPLLPDHFFIKHKGRFIRVDLSDIGFVQAQGNYCLICRDKNRYPIKATLREIHDKLPEPDFHQVHQSFIVNLTNIQEFDYRNGKLLVQGQNIPVSDTFRDELSSMLNLL